MKLDGTQDVTISRHGATVRIDLQFDSEANAAAAYAALAEKIIRNGVLELRARTGEHLKEH